MNFSSYARLFETAKKYVIKSAAKHIVFRVENLTLFVYMLIFNYGGIHSTIEK